MDLKCFAVGLPAVLWLNYSLFNSSPFPFSYDKEFMMEMAVPTINVNLKSESFVLLCLSYELKALSYYWFTETAHRPIQSSISDVRGYVVCKCMLPPCHVIYFEAFHWPTLSHMKTSQTSYWSNHQDQNGVHQHKSLCVDSFNFDPWWTLNCPQLKVGFVVSMLLSEIQCLLCKGFFNVLF